MSLWTLLRKRLSLPQRIITAVNDAIKSIEGLGYKVVEDIATHQEKFYDQDREQTHFLHGIYRPSPFSHVLAMGVPSSAVCSIDTVVFPFLQ